MMSLIARLSVRPFPICRGMMRVVAIMDEAVLNRLISRILIGEIKKIDGQRTQEVKIIYNFVGEMSR